MKSTPTYLFIYPSIALYTSLYNSIFIYLYIFIYLSIYLSIIYIYVFIYLSIYLSIVKGRDTPLFPSAVGLTHGKIQNFPHP